MAVAGSGNARRRAACQARSRISAALLAVRCRCSALPPLPGDGLGAQQRASEETSLQGLTSSHRPNASSCTRRNPGSADRPPRRGDYLALKATGRTTTTGQRPQTPVRMKADSDVHGWLPSTAQRPATWRTSLPTLAFGQDLDGWGGGNGTSWTRTTPWPAADPFGAPRKRTGSASVGTELLSIRINSIPRAPANTASFVVCRR